MHTFVQYGILFNSSIRRGRKAMQRFRSLLALTLLISPALCLPANARQSIYQAAQKGDVSRVRQLLKADPNLAKAKYKDRTALLDAAEKGHTAVVKLLLEKGADIN